MDNVVKEFKSYFKHDSFEKLPTPLYVAATDVMNGTTKYFHEGPLLRTVLASGSIPVVFDPVEIEGTYYIDGGILNNMPVEPVKAICDRVVGIHTNPAGVVDTPINMKMLMERSLMLAINCNIEMRKNMCDLFIEPEGLGKYRVFDIKKAREIFDIGYRYTADLLKSDIRLLREIG